MGGSLRWADHNAQKTCGIVVQRYQFNASDKKTALRARKWIPQLGTDLILLGLTQARSANVRPKTPRARSADLTRGSQRLLRHQRAATAEWLLSHHRRSRRMRKGRGSALSPGSKTRWLGGKRIAEVPKHLRNARQL